MTQDKQLTPEETARKIVDEIAKCVCDACEMGCGGECDVGNDYITCCVCQEPARKIYNDIFCKYREVLK